MASPLGSICRAAHRKDGEPLNVLAFPTHEAYETGLAKTGHTFWAVRAPGIKNWNTAYRPLPPNYILLNPERGDHQIPPEVDFDLVLSQNKFGQFQKAIEFSRRFQLPLVSLEHTLPVPGWGNGRLRILRQMKGHLNVFISEFSREAWGWEPEDAEVVHHGIDTDTFASSANIVKKPTVLSVCNDWINRDWCCGFSLWRQVTNGLAVLPIGDTPGLSKPAKSVADLVRHYQEAPVFLNTSLISPVPTSLLEAMSCGVACVSTSNCMLPEIIENGVNGFISNSPQELRQHINRLLVDKELASRLGAAARQTILTKFSQGSFVGKWNEVFERASNIVYTEHL